MAARVSEWMSTELLSVGRDEPARRALEILETGDVRHVLVLRGDALEGIVSNRDLIRITLQNAGRILDIDGCSVGDIMTPTPLEQTSPDADLREVARRMREQKVGALPVLDDSRTVGIITTDDVLAAFLEGIDR